MVLGASMVVRQPNRSGGGFDPDSLIAYSLIFSELMDGNLEMFVAAYKQYSTLLTAIVSHTPGATETISNTQQADAITY